MDEAKTRGGIFADVSAHRLVEDAAIRDKASGTSEQLEQPGTDYSLDATEVGP
ncbi:MAG: hypothetical protein M3P49_04875 [Actinomycetota bacterium]|nr:hypothetical protein [Actinomycetota bacterium]